MGVAAEGRLANESFLVSSPIVILGALISREVGHLENFVLINKFLLKFEWILGVVGFAERVRETGGLSNILLESTWDALNQNEVYEE